MEKYYIPEPNEFHIGFEYERLYDDNDLLYSWEKLIFDADNDFLTLSQIVHEITQDNIRVKYLDQQDIEDLGFEVFNKEENLDKICPSIWVHFKYKKDKLNQIHCQLHPYYYLRNKGITLNMKLRHGNFKCVVKNKSEFKRLLKQLNII